MDFDGQVTMNKKDYYLYIVIIVNHPCVVILKKPNINSSLDEVTESFHQLQTMKSQKVAVQ